MNFVNKIKLDNIPNVVRERSYLSIVERNTPSEANIFFKNLLLEPFNISEEICKKTVLKDISNILDKNISSKIKSDFFYKFWLDDMAKISTLFCETLGSESLMFSLETSRGCKRYHIDNVPLRLLVTYYGVGTEWLPQNACNYDAYYNGKANEKIVKDNSKKKFIKTWNIAVFKGQKFKSSKHAILHRTPDKALNKLSLLMRLDNPTYLLDS